MNQKGFAWTPFLIVVTVLVLLGLSVYPMVRGTIVTAEKQTAEANLYAFVLAIENSYYKEKVEHPEFSLADGLYDLGSDGSSLAQEGFDSYKFAYEGDRPNQGTIEIQNNKVKKATLRFGKYTVSYSMN